MADHNELGKQGEQQSFEYLLQKGYQVLHRNWHHGRDELDLVCRKDNMLVVVEVKTREIDCFGNPEDAVSIGKIRRIVHATQAYIEQYDVDLDVRFDVIAVIFSTAQGWQLEHFEDAFMAPVHRF